MRPFSAMVEVVVSPAVLGRHTASEFSLNQIIGSLIQVDPEVQASDAPCGQTGQRCRRGNGTLRSQEP